MAFVLIQHLDPTHASMMVELLAGHTPMTVQQAADGMPLEPDHVYLIPPGAYLAMQRGALRLSKPRERHGARLPFDFFLRSLAEECGARAICVILSGTGADGSLGLKAVKEKGGLVIVQDPDEAALRRHAAQRDHDGRGRSRAPGREDSGRPHPIQSRDMYVRRRNAGRRSRGRRRTSWLTEIIDLLRTKTAHDFSLYKPGTLQRRIERRMAMAAINDGGRYLELLREDPDELELLAKDLLINVTSFFRDPEAFDLLAEKMFPSWCAAAGRTGRCGSGSPGCSTGEETYSIAMLFLEAIAAAEAQHQAAGLCLRRR